MSLSVLLHHINALKIKFNCTIKRHQVLIYFCWYFRILSCHFFVFILSFWRHLLRYTCCCEWSLVHINNPEHVYSVQWDILALQSKHTRELAVDFCLFTGRSEFVQRLKLEATLNVHDGCVSTTKCHLSLINLCLLLVYVCVFMGAGFCQREGRPLKADADRTDTCAIVLLLRRGTESRSVQLHRWVHPANTDVALMCIWIRNTLVKCVYFF